MSGLKLFGRLGIVLLIFFSLQGEVIMRYAGLFAGKVEKHHSVSKNLAERQKLIKLQCFAKDLQPAIIPKPQCYIDQLIGCEFKSGHHLHNDTFRPFHEPRCFRLRGPPSQNS